MIKYVEKPNLPENPVETVAISETAGEAIKKTEALGIKTIRISPCGNLNDGIACHADLQLIHIGNNKVIIPANAEHLFEQLKNLNFEVINDENRLKREYPGDVPLNAQIIGKYIICNKKTVSRKVLTEAEKAGLTVIDVKQGYTACSICVLNENAIITDDIGIFTAAQFFLNDVTLIEKNSIGLKNYNYGFIGGCCGKISKDTLAVNGSLMSHSDCNRIADALSRNNIKVLELRNGRMEDIGGILPLTEKTP